MTASPSPLLQPPAPAARSQNPFEAARLKLVRALLEMRAPAAYPNFPSPADHEGIAGHIREAAAIFDEWLASVGAEVRDNASGYISADLFAGTFFAAVDGNETWACEQQALELAGERRALRRA